MLATSKINEHDLDESLLSSINNHDTATTTTAGFMSASDKTKLDAAVISSTPMTLSITDDGVLQVTY